MDGKHLQCKLSEIGGLIGKIGKHNSKDIPIPDNSDTTLNIKGAITKLLDTIHKLRQQNPTRRRKKVSLDTFERLCRKATNLPLPRIKYISDEINKLCSKSEDTTNGFINLNELRRVKKMIKKWIITTLDKEEATLYAM